MTTLNEVLGAMLRDVNDAQAYSTRAARDLAAEWQDDPRLLPLDVPNAWISKLDLELRFAVADATLASPRTRDPKVSRSIFTAAAGGIAAAATHSAAAYVRERLDLADDRQRWETVAEAVEQPEFRARLRDHLEDALYGARSSLIGGSPPVVDADVGAAVIDDMLAEKFFGEGPLAPVFVEGSTARQQTMRRIAGVVQENLFAINASLSAAQSILDSDVAVIVSASALSELPANLISTLRIQLDMRKYRWLDDTLLIEQK